MTPPEKEYKRAKSEPDARNYRGSSHSQAGAESYDSPYWDAYGYNLKDNYGYSDKDYRSGYDYGSYPLSARLGGGDPCYGGVPGYRAAFMDPSFALGIFVVGAFGTYLLYNALQTAGIGRELSQDLLLQEFFSGKR